MKFLSKLGLLCALLATQNPAFAINSTLSEASALGSIVVVAGSMSVLDGSGQVVVKSIEAVADGVIVVVGSAAKADTASLKFVGKAAQGLSLGVGTVVTVSAQTTGYLLLAAGKAIAFIPNEIGSSLLHHSSHSHSVSGKN
jgi:hypothetical protein